MTMARRQIGGDYEGTWPGQDLVLASRPITFGLLQARPLVVLVPPPNLPAPDAFTPRPLGPITAGQRHLAQGVTSYCAFDVGVIIPRPDEE